MIAAVFAALTMMFSRERAQAEPRSVVVPANVEWFDTGIDVRASVVFMLQIDATGQWTNAAGGQPVGPRGYGTLKLPSATAPNQPFASLIARVDQTTFGIGDRFRKRSPATGRLYLSMNDIPGTFGDNTGEMVVVVDQPTNQAATSFEDPAVFLDLQSPDPQPYFTRPMLKWTVKNKMRSRVIGTIHDSIEADVHRDELEEFIEKVVEVMTIAVRKHWDWVIVPLEAEVEWSETNWYEKKAWK